MSASYEAIFPSLRTVKPAYAPPAQYGAPGSAAAPPSNDSFAHDVMEILNPLQHIPIVSTIYRHMTGDQIGPMERVAGDTLYGGVLGLVSSVANIAFEKLTGKDFGDTALAMLGIGQDKPTAVAASATPAQPAPSRVADSAPALLIPVALTSVSPSPTPGAVPNAPETNASTDSLNRKDVDLRSSASSAASVTPLLPVATDAAAPNDTNANALKASLNRDGIGTDLSLRAMYAYRKSLALPAGAASADTTLH